MVVNFEGIVNIYKPEGITSFDVVSKLRRLFKIKRIGHCGTLDPFARGVLPVCIGKATAAVRYMDNYDKSYTVTAVFGEKKDTQDKLGITISKKNISEDYLKKLKENHFSDLIEAVNKIKDTTSQIPPMYSAIKIDGKPLYKYAREGIEIKRNARSIKIYKMEIVDISINDGLSAVLNIDCSKGTYIRTICDDLGDLMGLHAYANSLERTKCGPFILEDSITIEQLESLLSECKNQNELFSCSKAFSGVPFALSEYEKIILPKQDALRIIHGQKINYSNEYKIGSPKILFDDEQNWIGVVRVENNILKAERIFIDVQSYIEKHTNIV